MKLTLELERETDGRWIAEVPEMPGVIVYGSTPEDATRSAVLLLFRVIAEKLEHGELVAAGGLAAAENGIELPLVPA